MLDVKWSELPPLPDGMNDFEPISPLEFKLFECIFELWMNLYEINFMSIKLVKPWWNCSSFMNYGILLTTALKTLHLLILILLGSLPPTLLCTYLASFYEFWFHFYCYLESAWGNPWLFNSFFVWIYCSF